MEKSMNNIDSISIATAQRFDFLIDLRHICPSSIIQMILQELDLKKPKNRRDISFYYRDSNICKQSSKYKNSKFDFNCGQILTINISLSKQSKKFTRNSHPVFDKAKSKDPTTRSVQIDSQLINCSTQPKIISRKKQFMYILFNCIIWHRSQHYKCLCLLSLFTNNFFQNDRNSVPDVYKRFSYQTQNAIFFLEILKNQQQNWEKIENKYPVRRNCLQTKTDYNPLDRKIILYIQIKLIK